MTSLLRLSLRSSAVVGLVVALLVAAGLYAASNLNRELIPSLEAPIVQVTVPLDGASPTAVERQIAEPLEDAMQGLPQLDRVSSTSQAGSAAVLLTFDFDAELDEVRASVNERLAQARGELPDEAGDPFVESFTTDIVPILQYAVSSDAEVAALGSRLTERVVPAIEGLEGVREARVSGAPTQVVRIELDRTRLAAAGLTVGDVSGAIEQAALVAPLGEAVDGDLTVPVEIAGRLQDAGDVAAVRVPGDGGAVRVGSLGKVALTSEPPESLTRTDGRPSIGLEVTKATDANTVTVAEEVEAELPRLERELGDGVRFRELYSDATPITNSISSVVREGLIGGVFAILVIFGFLRGWRATLVAATSIPLSLLVTLLVLYRAGITLNVLTLGAMMIAIGRVVDDSIVVLENITRHVDDGVRASRAAFDGAREVLTAVTSSTLTSVAVFLPIAFVTGIIGELFRPFALTVVVALLASLLVSVTVAPVVAARLLRPPRSGRRPEREDALHRAYRPVITWSLRHRAAVLGAAGLLFLGSLAIVPGLRINLLDESSGEQFGVSVQMPQDASLAQTDREARTVERLLRDTTGVKTLQATAGGVDANTGQRDVASGKLTLITEASETETAIEDARRRLRDYRGPASVEVDDGGGGATDDVAVTIEARDDGDLERASRKVTTALGEIDGLERVSSNLTGQRATLRLSPRPEAVRVGVTPELLAVAVSDVLTGRVAAEVDLQQGRVDAVVTTDDPRPLPARALERLVVDVGGQAAPLGELARVERVASPTTVNRTDGERTATVSATIGSDDTSAAKGEVDTALRRLDLPPGATTTTTGAFEELDDGQRQLGLALLAAIACVYLVMVATFRSLLKPLVLLVAVPFAFTGALVALLVTGTSLSLAAGIGVLMLVGIVVTNAIVLLDLVERYRRDGMDLRRALIEGGGRRLRPILMTALATVFALVPLALEIGGAEGGTFISAPLAIVVIGGLVTSTVLTLVLVPVLYSLVDRFTRQPAGEDPTEAAAAPAPPEREEVRA